MTAKAIGQITTCEEAEVTIICRKIYWQDLVRDNIPQEVMARVYPEADSHRMFVGEVVEIIKA